VGLVVLVVTTYSTGLYQQEVNQKLNHAVATHIVSEIQLFQNNAIDKAALQDLFHNLMVFNPSIEIYLLDINGNILAYSAPAGKVKRQRVDLNPIQTYLRGQTTFPLVGDDPRDSKRKKVFSAAPIINQDRLEGYLYVILGGEQYDNVVDKLRDSYILTLSIWIIVAGLLFSAAAGLVLFHFLTKKLRHLTNVVATFKQKNPLKHLPLLELYQPGDEIEQLSISFREMAKRIDEQMEALQKIDSLRRELVANVSHDLRTPLTTLQGYIETLTLTEKPLSTQERQRYLDIALQHCRRLNKLVKELFELAKLEAQDIKVQRESFNLAELVQDVTQKFYLMAKEKQIEIVIEIKKVLPFAYADIGLIERVLENLLENALRHTPQQGKIYIILTHHHNAISIQISDTGCGIPQAQLPYIFERFYQRNKYHHLGEHAGLGLAISKKIIELHKSSIQVNSKNPIGTTFSFQLPIFSS
jgi:signal transduction histidine kinase